MYEVEDGTDSVGKGEGIEAANVWFGEVEGLFVGRRGHDVIFVFVGMGAYVCVKNAVGASSHNPGRSLRRGI